MPQFDHKLFFEGFRKFLNAAGKPLNQSRVDAVEFLLTAFENDTNWKSIPQIAYAFATIAHETDWTFKPITEYGSKAYFNRYEPTTKIGKQLDNTEPGDGYRYRGAGFVQITGRTNFRKFGIEDTPEQALDPQTAFEILSVGMQLGSFTGKRLSNFINGNQKDYINARQVINGHDKDRLIAGYAQQLETILKASQDTNVYEYAAGEFKHPSAETLSVSTANDPLKPTEELPVPSNEVPPIPKERVAVVKAAPPKWYAGLGAKLTAVVTGNGLVQWVTDKLATIQDLGIPSQVWWVIGIIVGAASIIWIADQIWDNRQKATTQKEIDDLLVKENSTTNNLVQLIPADEVDLYRLKGFKIITRGDKLPS